MRLYYQIPLDQWPELLDIALEILSIICRYESERAFTCGIYIMNQERDQIKFVLVPEEGNSCLQTDADRVKVVLVVRGF
jgi:hypothetical protein